MKNFASVLRSKQDECLAGLCLLHLQVNSLPVSHQGNLHSLENTAYHKRPKTFTPLWESIYNIFATLVTIKHLGVLFLSFFSFSSSSFFFFEMAVWVELNPGCGIKSTEVNEQEKETTALLWNQTKSIKLAAFFGQCKWKIIIRITGKKIPGSRECLWEEEWNLWEGEMCYKDLGTWK